MKAIKITNISHDHPAAITARGKSVQTGNASQDDALTDLEDDPDEDVFEDNSHLNPDELDSEGTDDDED